MTELRGFLPALCESESRNSSNPGPRGPGATSTGFKLLKPLNIFKLFSWDRELSLLTSLYDLNPGEVVRGGSGGADGGRELMQIFRRPSGFRICNPLPPRVLPRF